MSFTDRLADFHASLCGDFVAAVEANRFVEQMEAEHPAELAEWMRANAVKSATAALGDRDRSQRSEALRHAGRRAFAAVVAESVEDRRGVPVIDVRWTVDEENTRRPLRLMNGEDCVFAARDIGRQSRRLAMEEAFLLEVGKRAGRKRVENVLDEATVERLWRNLVDSTEAAQTAVAA